GGGHSGRAGGGGPSPSNPYSRSGRPSNANNGPVQREDHDRHYMPISALNPYQNRWAIKARVTQKSDIRRWSNARGEGHLFSIDLLDESATEIRGTFFKDACDRWYEFVQPGEVYSFQGGRIKVCVMAH
ncbi:unnamed protein product, partial [Discosporangium mesarthrocarpum]